MDRASPERLFLWDGEIFQVESASLAHERIVSNLVGWLRAALGAGPCEVLPSNLRVRVPGTDRYVYPDAIILCGAPDLEDGEADTLLNPTVVLEVLSRGTEAFDRGEKAAGYRRIPHLTAYVLVSQASLRVEVFTRGEGSWTLREYAGASAAELPLGPGSIRVPLEEIYARSGVTDRGE